MKTSHIYDDTYQYRYQVLVDHEWLEIDPRFPVINQTKGMRAYRALDKHGNIIKLSTRESS